MNQFLFANKTQNDSTSHLSESPTSSPRLSQEFSTLRVVSEESLPTVSQEQRTTTTTNTMVVDPQDQFQDAPEEREEEASALQALAQLCAAQQEPSLQVTEADFRISHNDVLCGRGGLTNHHSGNVFFRQLVRMKQEAYLRASKRAKAGVAREIVDLIRQLSPPGRFLKKTSNGVWVQITDRKAREKTSQALREGAPELRSQQQQQKQQQQERSNNNNNAASMLLMERQWQQQQQRVQLYGGPPPTQEMTTLLVTPTNSAEENELFHNRSRIVSDDSVGAGFGHFFPSAQENTKNQQPQHNNMVVQQEHGIAGTKRSHEEACSVQEESNKRGPRLKLIKSRMQNVH